MKIKVPVYPLAVFLMFSSSWCYGQGDDIKIRELLAKAEKAPPYQCELVSISYVAGNAQPKHYTGPWKIWYKRPYIRSDMGGGLIYIDGPNSSYEYDAAEDQYIKRPMSRVPLVNEFYELMKDAQWNFKIVGNEVIDGKICVVIRGDQATNTPPDVSHVAKFWIWKTNGLLVQAEHTFTKGTTTSYVQVEAKHFTFGDIPDSVFAIPKEKVAPNSFASEMR